MLVLVIRDYLFLVFVKMVAKYTNDFRLTPQTIFSILHSVWKSPIIATRHQNAS